MDIGGANPPFVWRNAFQKSGLDGILRMGIPLCLLVESVYEAVNLPLPLALSIL